MKKIAIVGSGGLGREVLGIIQSINKQNEIWDFVGFFDDNLTDELINGYYVLGKVDALNLLKEELYIIIAIGNPKIKELLYRKITNPNIKFPVLIHPSVMMYTEETISIGEGVVIGANCVLTVNIHLGNHAYLNTASILSHDVFIDDFSMIMPTVAISAGAKIGKRVYLGNGVKIDKPIIIENDIQVKCGAILP